MKQKINIVLYEPEIAGNVAAIMRTCVAVNAKLHLIEPLGFFWDERFIKRASAGYALLIDYQLYEDWDTFLLRNPDADLFFSTRYARKMHSDCNFSKKTAIYLVFGKESTGIPKHLLQQNLQQCFRIAMSKNVRSLNVASSVAIVSYEVMRQWGYVGLSKEEVQKGNDFLDR